ncbi:MAG: thiamine diphosphokinase [Anaerolineae bacterium]|nr:thiamine diphosphokinase [Thermoflexales bacterium]MDW8054190.1 thiamine diphosphokinase [Anaerolineae bacterium]
MSRAVIIANGEPPSEADARRWLRDEDVLICADGGANAALALNLKPHHVVGDFDSLSEATVHRLQALGAQLHRYPTRKNETDLELALLLATQLTPRPEAIIVLGAFGGRLDHTLANMLLLAVPALRGWSVTLAHGTERAMLIDAREAPATLVLHGTPGDTVSLIPFGGDVHGISTEGLEYPLHDEPLFIGPARGVSNVLISPRARVHVRRGLLLCIMRETQASATPLTAIEPANHQVNCT